MSSVTRVAIIHPWMPQYRIKFFQDLTVMAALHGIEISVFYGEAPLEWKNRNDTLELPGATALSSTFIKLGHKSLIYKSLKPILRNSKFDLVIVEHAIRNLETYVLMATGTPIAYWGHGKSYTIRPSLLQENLKFTLARMGQWFFSYTRGGFDALTGKGVDASRITVLNNSIDTKTLTEDLANLSDSQLAEISRRYDTTKGKTGLYIGGLDAIKRIPNLLEAASIIHLKDPEFRLFIAGDGDLSEQVAVFAKSNSWCVYLGPLFGREKAKYLAASDFLLVPGLVGLVAVDSFVSGTPIITSSYEFHAPEYEYLTDRVTALISEDSVADLAATVLFAMHDDRILETLRSNCLAAASAYTLENMVENFIRGIESWRSRKDEGK